MPIVAVVYHSGYGHTKRQAEAVAAGVETVAGCSSALIDVTTMGDGDWSRIEGADAMILGAPTYMGSASAPFKAFMDSTSKRWFQSAPMKDKLAAAFTCSASQNGDKTVTLHQLFAFTMQLRMIWIGLGLPPGNNSSMGSVDDINRLGSFAGAMAQANADQGPDVAPPESDLRTAKYLGERVARIATVYNRAQLPAE
jgi:multimeric flavodoxin WrbA